jgi:hypothetical protein
MSPTKCFADLLTSLRLLLAFVVAYVGYAAGASALPLVMGLLMVSWTTDSLDGFFARKTPEPEHSWLGDHDADVDVCMFLSKLVYLTFSGYVDPVSAWGYVLIAGLVVIGFRSNARFLVLCFMVPIGALMIWVALQEAPPWGWAAVIWCLLAATLNWGRFSFLVRKFFADMRGIELRESGMGDEGTRERNHVG